MGGVPGLLSLNAAQALNKSYHRGPSALRGSAIVNQATSGTEADDLSQLIASVGKVTAALNVHEEDLGELFGNFDAFFHNFWTPRYRQRGRSRSTSSRG